MMKYPFSFVFLDMVITTSCMTVQWQLSPSTKAWSTARGSTDMTSMDLDLLTRCAHMMKELEVLVTTSMEAMTVEVSTTVEVATITMAIRVTATTTPGREMAVATAMEIATTTTMARWNASSAGR